MSVVSVLPSRPRGVAPATVVRIVEATAILWCRHLTFPTAREVAALAGIAASSVVGAFGGMAALFEAVVDGELADLHRCASAVDAGAALAAHVDQLRRRDPALVRLPWMATARAASRSIDIGVASVYATNVPPKDALFPVESNVRIA